VYDSIKLKKLFLKEIKYEKIYEIKNDLEYYLGETCDIMKSFKIPEGDKSGSTE